ncbi:unnamed protein product [Lampetra fluviatilis]
MDRRTYTIKISCQSLFKCHAKERPLSAGVGCHQNDIENILPFLGVGLLYALSGPDPWIALLHFRVFLASRIVHTIAYLAPLPQPTRAIAYLLGVVSTFSMAVAVMRLRVYV